MKPVEWLGSSQEDVRSFSPIARQNIGYQLYRVQNGLDPSDWKPMSSIGSGVNEIRIHAETEHRVIYIAKFEEAIYVLHAFVKKTPKTSKKDIDLASRRLKELLILRKDKK
jgi:phage-related protein